MCIIIYSPDGARIAADTLRRAYRGNPDGAGVLWLDDSGVHTRRGLMTVDALEAAYDDIPAGAIHAVHCRISTGGKVNEGNTHPFTFTAGRTRWALMHNGILHHVAASRRRSDTRILAEDIAPLVLANGMTAAARAVLDSVADGSRVLLANDRGKVYLLGDWTERGGLYYSNSTLLGTASIYRWSDDSALTRWRGLYSDGWDYYTDGAAMDRDDYALARDDYSLATDYERGYRDGYDDATDDYLTEHGFKL